MGLSGGRVDHLITQAEKDLRLKCLELATNRHTGTWTVDQALSTAQKFYEFVNDKKGEEAKETERESQCA